MKKTLLLLAVLLASFASAIAATVSDTYEKVMSTADISVGDEYILCYETNAMGALSGKYYTRISNGVTLNGNVATIANANVNAFTIEEGTAASTFALKLVSGNYITCTGTGNNSMGSNSTLVANCNMSITINNGVATIIPTANSNNNQNKIQCNTNSGQERFSNYKTGTQKNCSLYKKVTAEIPEVEPATPVVKVNGVVMESEFEIEEGTEITVSSENAVNLKESGSEEALNNPYIFAPEAGVHSYEFVGINGTYTSAALRFTVTVKEPVVEHFYLVNATTSLNEEDSYILVNIEKALAASTTIGNYAGTTSVNMAADNLSCNFVNKDVLFFNLINNGDSWSLRTQNLGENNGYLCSASSSNYLQVRDDINANAKASITISELNEAQIKFQSGASSYLRYNATSPRFSCYNSSTNQQPVYLFSNNKLALAPIAVFDEDAKTIEVTVAEGCHIHYKHHVEKGAANAAALAEEGWNTQETNHYVFNVADESMFEQTTNTGDNGHFTFRAFDPESQKYSAETVRVLSHNALSGIVDIEAEGNGEVEYFNLQGVRVAEPANGLYLRRSGNKVEKVVIR